MSDTPVVGIIGIFATAVIGPLIAYHIRKDEEGRRETIAALDGAVDALTTARGTVNWIQGIASEMTGRQRHVDVELRRSLDEIHAAESYATRLHLRLGQNPITEAYADAVGSLSVLGADVYARYPGDAPSPSTIEVNPARKDIERQTTDFIRHARRWHEDELGQR